MNTARPAAIFGMNASVRLAGIYDGGDDDRDRHRIDDETESDKKRLTAFFPFLQRPPNSGKMCAFLRLFNYFNNHGEISVKRTFGVIAKGTGAV